VSRTCTVCHPPRDRANLRGKDEYKHRVAVSLVMNYPDIVPLPTDTMTKAARRFRDWLDAHRSEIELESRGDRKYRLRLREQPDSV